MKNKFTKLSAVFALLAFLVVPLGMRGQTRTEVTWTASEQGYSNGQSLDGVSIELDDYITIQFDKNDGNNPPAYYNTGTAARLYSKNSLTVTPASGYQITGMTLTFSGTGYTGTLGASVGSYSLNSTTGTWSGSSTDAVVLTNNATSGHARLQVLTVTYTDGSTPPPTTYTVTYNANVTGNAPVVDTYNEGANVTLRPANTFTNEGYTFSEWNTQADGDGDAYDAGDVIEDIQENIELYAIWTENAPSNDHWVLTNFADLTSNDVFVIVGNGYAMTNNNGTAAAPAVAAVTIEGSEITSTVAATIQWTVSGDASNGYTFYPNGSTTTWLYCNTTNPSGSNNNMRVGTGDRKVFELNSNDYLMTKDDYAVRYLSIYNNADWRGYINTNLCPALSFYKKVTGGVLPPSITAANVTLAYNDEEGSISYIVNNPVELGVLTAEVTEGYEWISTDEQQHVEATGTVGLIFDANSATTARTATVTLTYTYENREAVIKDVTVTQAAAPVSYTTIPDLFAAATSTETPVYVTFNNWVVSGVSTNGKNVFVTDNNGNGFVIFDNNGGLGDTYTAGDVLAGTAVSCSLKKYNGFAELLNVNATDLTITAGGTVIVANVAMADLAGVNTGALVHYDNLTCNVDNNKYYLSDGTTTIQVYNTLYAFEALVAGKTYNITGVYQQYNSTKEILPRSAADIEEVVAPAEPSVTVTPNVITALAEGTSGTLAITYENIPDLISFDYYFCDANGGELEDTDPNYPDWIDAEIQEENDVYSVVYTINANEGDARTAYFKVYTTDTPGNEEVYAIVTVNQAAYVVPSTDYAELPFAFDGGRADIENTDGLTQNGLGSDFNNSPKLKFNDTDDWMILHFNEEPGLFSFVIRGTGSPFSGTFTVETSVDGVDYETLATYTELGDAETMTFDDLDADVRYIRWYFTEKVTGCNVGIGDIHLYDLGGGPAPVASITVAPATLNLDAQQHYINSLNLTYENIEVENTQSFTVHYYNAQGEEIELVQGEAWMVAGVVKTNDIYQVLCTIMANEGDARTAYFKVSAQDANDNTVYSNLVTVNQAAPFTGPTYTLATSVKPGRHYIIVGFNGDNAYAMGRQNSNNRAAVPIIVVDSVAQVASDDVVEFVVNTVGFTDEVDPYTGGQSGWGMAVYPGYWQYTIYDPDTLGYLYAASSFNNYLRTETHLDADDNGVWSIEIYNETINEIEYENVAHIVAFGNNTRKLMRFNSASGVFSCYGDGNNQKDVYLYVKDEDEPQYDFYKDITGYGTSNGGYCLVATPTTESANPNMVGMITDDGTNPENFSYDLYSFDFTQELEWLNYRAGAFNLLNGQGYLYANQSNVTLHFQGASYASKTVSLQFGDTNYDWNGWNLIGNPLSDVAWVGTSNFYVMNTDGTEVELAERSYVNPMEGIFVKASAANQSIYFTNDFWYYEEPGGEFAFRVSGENGSDVARVCFGEGQGLEKFQLNPNHTKVYFQQGSKDYAVVRSANEGEMPVSFKAEENGTYTFSVNTESVEMNYLHLIDNMTGDDVDLLANPSYTFEAKTTDYTSRFKLVFSANNSINENANETFAFFNGSEWCISNIGEATLQLVDVTGRIVSSKTVNGNATLTTDNLSAGVYVMRLVNGNNVKMQKVVVK